MDISIVIPLLDEEESLPELFTWIETVMTKHGFSYEVIFVDDGSRDNSWNIIKGLKEKSDNVKAIRFRKNYGKSPALHCAFRKVEGEQWRTTRALRNGLFRPMTTESEVRFKDNGIYLIGQH